MIVYVHAIFHGIDLAAMLRAYRDPVCPPRLTPHTVLGTCAFSDHDGYHTVWLFEVEDMVGGQFLQEQMARNLWFETHAHSFRATVQAGQTVDQGESQARSLVSWDTP